MTWTSLPPAPIAAGPPPSLARAVGVIDPVLEEVVGRLSPAIEPAVRYHLASGGKRVRAALALLSAAAVSGDDAGAVAGAVGIELVHNFSLIHDDIIDGDESRRGRPTVWSKFGVGTAIIAGDAVLALANQVLLEDPSPHAARAAAFLGTATQQMIAGQADDMAFETERVVSVEQCVEMSRCKTGALLRCASALGAILVGGTDTQVEALGDYGTHLGIAFQAIDDVLGIWGDPEATGKSAANDVLRHKKTLPIAAALASGDPSAETLADLLTGDLDPDDVARVAALIDDLGGRDHALALADHHLDAAIAALGSVPLAATAVAELSTLAHYVTERDR